MSFNPDRTKQAQEVIFSRKKNNHTHAPLFLNNSEMKLSSNQNPLGLTLDSKLSFNEHINDKNEIGVVNITTLFLANVELLPYNFYCYRC